MSAASIPRERWWFIPHSMIVLAVACVVGPILLIVWAVASTTVGPVTIGNGSLVFWHDYPGDAATDPDDALAGATAETTAGELAAALSDADAAIAALPSSPWTPEEVMSGQSGTRNGYGGSSMLVQAYASTQATAGRASTDAERDAALAVLRSVLAAHGYTGWSVDDSSADWVPSDYDSDGVTVRADYRSVSVTATASDGREIVITIDDQRVLSAADASGTASGDAATADPTPSPTATPTGGSVATAEPSPADETLDMIPASGPSSSIFLSASAGHLLPEASQAAFTAALEPFAGLDRPDGMERY